MSVGMRFGRYELTGKLGVGGMGEVFRAHDQDLHCDVAVKFLPERFASDPIRLARFAQESRAVSSLNHPNIVTIHEIGEESGLHYIVMELVEGQTLREIVHRDLKPESVMVTGDGLVKVLDFGLAKLRATPPGIERSGSARSFPPGRPARTLQGPRTARSLAPSGTCRPSRPVARWWTSGPISSPSGRSSTRWRRGGRRSVATVRPRP